MFKFMDLETNVTAQDGTFVSFAEVTAEELVDTIDEKYGLSQSKLSIIEDVQPTKGLLVKLKSGRSLTIPNTARLLAPLEKVWAKNLEVNMPIAIVDEIFDIEEEEKTFPYELVLLAKKEFLETSEVHEAFRSIAGRRALLKALIEERGWLYGNKWAKSQHHIEYAMTTPRPAVARQIQQMFLQFGIHSIVRKREVNKHTRYIVSVHGTHEMKLLYEQFEKELRDKKNYEQVKDYVSIMRPIEVYPIELSHKIEQERLRRDVQRSKMVIKETGNERYRPKTTHRREHLKHFAKVLDMPELEQIAGAAIRYDRIVSIEKTKFDGIQVEIPSGYLIVNGVVVC